MRKILLFLVGVLTMSLQLLAQTRNVSGNVLDNNGQPLPGVTVRVVGGNGVTTTDSRGAFILEVPSTTRSLEISYVGYVNQTVTIPAQGIISVTLVEGDNTLSEVVVTGYTRQKKSEYSGSATKITSERIELTPTGSFDQILQGKSPGLLVTAGSGQPGSDARVQIRGASSISGGSDPLYVVDGVPVEAGVFQSLNPNDFESVDVLRDASATALYGNRGGTGVIVITTKKGRAGKTQVNYLSQYGITQAGVQKFNMMNSTELLQLQENLGKLTNNTSLPGWAYSKNRPFYQTLPATSPASNPYAASQARYDFLLDSLRSINTNWADVFQRQGNFQSHDIQLSGGSERTRFYTSLGYFSEDGIALRSDMKRYTFRTNVDHQTDRFTAGINAAAGYTKRNFIEAEEALNLGNPFAAAYLGLPYKPLYNKFGTLDTGNNVGANAYDRIVSAASNSGQLKTNLNLNGVYKLTNHISLGGFFGLDYRQTLSERTIYPNTYFANNQAFPLGRDAANGIYKGQGQFGETFVQFFTYVSRATAGYNKTFSDRHELDVSANIEFTKEYNKSHNYTGYGINPALLNTSGGITPGNLTNRLIPVVGGGKTQRSYFGAIAIARYTFDNKYTINASYRRDGTSILPEQNRWDNFYAAGLTWNVLRENFALNWERVNDLSMRLSYGQSASADNFPLGTFGYLPTFGTGQYVGEGQLIAPSNAGNSDATWEKITTLNFGVDFGMFQNRLSGSIDLYNKITNDNFVSQQLSATSGFTSLTVNAAKVRNRGVELLLNGDVIRTRNLTWSVGGNISYNDNEVLDLGQVEEFEQGTEIVRVGLPLGSHYDVKWAGVDAATGQPLYYTKDGKITDQYSTANKVADFGTYNAPWIGGFNTGLQFKGFNLQALFTFQQGFSRGTNQDFFGTNHAFASSYNQRVEMLTMWSQPGDITNIQSPLYAREFSSKDIHDASYLRFRTLQLSYSFAKSLVSRTKVLSGARVFAQAQNLYTWTNWVGFDPEDDNNLAVYEYPLPRTFTVGIDINF